jgi:hypothetical protein
MATTGPQSLVTSTNKPLLVDNASSHHMIATGTLEILIREKQEL